MHNRQTKELIEIINTRLKMIFQTSESCQNDTLWYNSMTTLLDQCIYDTKRAIHDFFKTKTIVNKKDNVIVNKKDNVIDLLIELHKTNVEIKDILSDFLVQYHNYEGKK